MQTEVIVALIVSSLSLIGVLINTAISAKKNELEVLREIIDRLRERIDDLECENEELADWAERLVNQVKNAGLQPVKLVRRKKDEKR